jgi:hypothetical protein
MNLKYGTKIEVYRNLHKKCFSVRHKGKVIYHLKDNEQLSLTNVKFVVQPAGRAKVLREKRKNVHAFVRGEFNAHSMFSTTELYFAPFDSLDFLIATYNPYKSNRFQVVLKGEDRSIGSSSGVLIREGKVYANHWSHTWPPTYCHTS